MTTRFLALGITSAVALASVLAITFANAASPQKPVAATTSPSAKSRVFELRTYYTHPGKLDDLNKRFRDHTCRIFQKHGMEIVGFWTPQDEKDGKADKLVYMLAYPSRDAAKASWKAFGEDAEWKTAKAESEKAGPIVKKVESVYLDPTDYSTMK